MIADQHDISNFLIWIQSAGSIGNEETFNPQLLHNTHRKGHFLHGIAFVVMKSAFHRDYFFAAKLPKN